MQDWSAPQPEEADSDPLADAGAEDPEDVDVEKNLEEAREETGRDSDG
jgi:hypothetical protein